MEHFKRPPKTWDEIFFYFQQVPLGQRILNEFFEKSQNGRIRIEAFPAELKAQLESAAEPTSPPLPLGAAFTTDGTTGLILIDYQSHLGTLVPFLFHEIVHSLDENLWRAARSKLTRAQKQNLIFEAECRAFRAQNDFLSELKVAHPDLKKFYEASYPTLSFLHRALLPHEIAELYKITETD